MTFDDCRLQAEAMQGRLFDELARVARGGLRACRIGWFPVVSGVRRCWAGAAELGKAEAEAQERGGTSTLWWPSRPLGRELIGPESWEERAGRR